MASHRSKARFWGCPVGSRTQQAPPESCRTTTGSSGLSRVWEDPPAGTRAIVCVCVCVCVSPQWYAVGNMLLLMAWSETAAKSACNCGLGEKQRGREGSRHTGLIRSSGLERRERVTGKRECAKSSAVWDRPRAGRDHLWRAVLLLRLLLALKLLLELELHLQVQLVPRGPLGLRPSGDGWDVAVQNVGIHRVKLSGGRGSRRMAPSSRSASARRRAQRGLRLVSRLVARRASVPQMVGGHFEVTAPDPKCYLLGLCRHRRRGGPTVR